MKKLATLLPALLTIFAAAYGLFDARVFAYLGAHANVSAILGSLFVISEAMANTDFVKSNSVGEAVCSFVESVLGRVLHKQS